MTDPMQVEEADDPWKVAADELCKYAEQQEERAKTAEAKVARLVALAGHWLRPRDHAMDEWTEATIHCAKGILAALAGPTEPQ